MGVLAAAEGRLKGALTCVIRSFTTEGTEATEAGRKGYRIRIPTLASLRSVSVISVLSVVKSGDVQHPGRLPGLAL